MERPSKRVSTLVCKQCYGAMPVSAISTSAPPILISSVWIGGSR